MSPQIKINGKDVLLTPQITYPRKHDCQSYYMGNNDSDRYYSYLPIFKKLISRKDGVARKFVKVEIEFDWS